MQYMEYLEDELLEAANEMNKYLGEAAVEYIDDIGYFPEAKEGVFKDNYYFRDHLQIPNVSGPLSKNKNQEIIIEFISKFLDDHEKELSTAGPTKTFTFGNNEVGFLYDMFNTTPDKLLETYNKMVEETYYGKISKFMTGWVVHAPHKILITCMLIEAIQKGYDDIVECCEYMWAFTEYPIIYREYWSLGVKKDVMDYTVEHLGSKYNITKVKNIQELLKYHAHKSVTANYDKLKTGLDNVYMDFMYRMRNQINNSFRNIANAYYDNYEKNASQHTNVVQFDDDTLADQEGHMTNMAQVIDNTISRFASGGINTTMIGVAAEGSQVDKDNLSNFINQIWASKNNRVHKFVEDIITIYFNKNPANTSLGSNEFMNFGLALYRSIGTSKDPLYQEVKDILIFWIYDIVNIKQYYGREGTWIAYTRAVFNYMILMINHYN